MITSHQASLGSSMTYPDRDFNLPHFSVCPKFKKDTTRIQRPLTPKQLNARIPFENRNPYSKNAIKWGQFLRRSVKQDLFPSAQYWLEVSNLRFRIQDEVYDPSPIAFRPLGVSHVS